MGRIRSVGVAGTEALEHEAPVAIGQGLDVGPCRGLARQPAHATGSNAIGLKRGADRLAAGICPDRAQVIHRASEPRQLHGHVHGIAAHQAVTHRRKEAVDAIIAHGGEGSYWHIPFLVSAENAVNGDGTQV